MLLPQHALLGILPWGHPSKLPSYSKGQAGPIIQLEQVENTQLQREQGSPRGSRTIQRGAASPRFWKLDCQADTLGSMSGMPEAPQNLPSPRECGGAGSHHAKHDLAGSAGVENHFDVMSASWNYSLHGSFSVGNLHLWEEASRQPHNRRVPH